MLRRLYDWTMSLATRETAIVWLGIIAFVKSSIFPVPADLLLIPMALARPERAWRYALVATIASVLGGVAGWYLGHYAFDALARPLLEFYGKLCQHQPRLFHRVGDRCTGRALLPARLAAAPLRRGDP